MICSNPGSAPRAAPGFPGRRVLRQAACTGSGDGRRDRRDGQASPGPLPRA